MRAAMEHSALDLTKTCNITSEDQLIVMTDTIKFGEKSHFSLDFSSLLFYKHWIRYEQDILWAKIPDETLNVLTEVNEFSQHPV